jgi:hypothetical protein
MPKTKKGRKIEKQFQKTYGSKRGKSVMYATAAKQGGKLYSEIHGRKKSKKRA